MKKSQLKRRGIRKRNDKCTGPMWHGPWFFTDIQKLTKLLHDIKH